MKNGRLAVAVLLGQVGGCGCVLLCCEHGCEKTILACWVYHMVGIVGAARKFWCVVPGNQASCEVRCLLQGGVLCPAGGSHAPTRLYARRWPLGVCECVQLYILRACWLALQAQL